MAVEYPASNTSYTNKDFQSIFPELLDLTKKLTNKYDPQLSNESDPMIVLYKLLAFIGDKNNYNIDKNVLETFPLSVTQYGNARQLYDSLGYSMKYYQAASLTLSLGLKLNTEETTDARLAIKNGNGEVFVTIPRFTMFTDSDGKYVYTSTEEQQLNSLTQTRQIRALQGTVNTYSLNGVETITLNHLDADLRLYFIDKQVAENGVFISNVGQENWDKWSRVDNLESYPLNNLVYKFGVLPNSGTCYIQFPQDIANLIQGGLTIKYLSTSGGAGNVQARTIDQFYQETDLALQGLEQGTEVGVNTSNISVINISSSYDGEDPEDLESAYRNYKKQVGTFNTLVTLHDYDSAIYNAVDGNGDNLISNGVTSDRTNDPHYSNHIVTLEEDGNFKKLKVDTIDGQNVTSYVSGNITAEEISVSDNKFTYNGVEYTIDTTDGQVTSTQPTITITQSDDNHLFTLDNKQWLIGGWDSDIDKITSQTSGTLILTLTENSSTIDNIYVQYVSGEWISTSTNIQFARNNFSYNTDIYNVNGSIKSTTSSGVTTYQVTISYAYKVGATETDTPKMTAFDLGLYVLNPMGNVADAQSYNKSFSTANTVQYDLQNELYDLKSSQHDFIDVLETEPYLFKNFYSLNGKVILYSKVGAQEAKQIEENIRTALYVNFNAREVDFGTEVSYDKLISVIKQADDRISYVVLDEPQYILRYLSTTDLIGEYASSFQIPSNLYKRLLERMVVNGNVQLYEFNHDFDYDFGQTAGTAYSNVGRVTTQVRIYKSLIYATPSVGESYKLRPNELIYLQAPNYVTASTYGPFVKYSYKLNSAVESGRIHPLSTDEFVHFTYQEDSVTKTDKYESGDCIKSSFNLDSGIYTNKTIGSSDSIEIVKENSSKIEDSIYAYWQVNNSYNQLFTDSDISGESPNYTFTHVLDSGEYFIYTDTNYTNLVVLGSGTKLVYTSSSADTERFKLNEEDIVEKIIQQGFSAISDNFEWNKTLFAGNNTGNLTITEMQIITLGEGCQLYGTIADDLTNAPQSIENPAYKENGGDAVSLSSQDVWQVYSRLGLVCGPDYPQTLSNVRTDVEQSLTISQGDSTSESITNKTIRTSKYISINGGENRDVLYIDDNGNYQPIKVYVCTDSPIMIGGTEVGRNDAGYYSVDKTWQGQTVSFSVTSGVASEKVIIPFIKQGDTDTLTVSSGEIYTISSGKFTISSIEYTIVYVEGTQNIEKLTFNDSDEIDVTDNTFTLGDAPNQVEYTILRKNDTNQTPVSVVISSNQSRIMTEAGTYYLVLPNSTSVSVTFSWDNSTTDEFALMGKPKIVSGYSKQVVTACQNHSINTSGFDTAVTTDFQEYDITYEVPETDDIEQDDPLSALSFFDSNNQFSPFTIPQIDTTNINVNVSAQSKQ